MDLEFAAKDIAVKNQMIHEKDDEIVKLKDSIALLENDITNAKSSTEELDKLRSEFEGQIEKLNSKISSDEYTIAELRKRRDELDKELIALKENQEKTTEVKELSSQELESYKNKVEDLESKLQVSKNEVLIKDKTIADSHSAFEELQKELSSSEATKRELEEKIELFKQVETSSGTMKEKIQNLEEKLQVKNTEYLMKDSKVNELLSANKVQEDKIIELQQTIDNTETQLYQLRKEASEYNKDMMNNDSLMERLRDLSEAKAKIESEKFDLAEQNQELQELLKTRYEQIDILERQINNMLELDNLEIGERQDIAGKIDNLVEHLEQNYNYYITSMNNK